LLCCCCCCCCYSWGHINQTAVAGYQTAVAGYQTAVAGYQTAVAGYQTAVAGYQTAVAGYQTACTLCNEPQWQVSKLCGRSPNCATGHQTARALRNELQWDHQTARALMSRQVQTFTTTMVHIAPLPCILARQPCTAPAALHRQPCRNITVLITGRRPAGLQAFLRP
jgi:hypothetical protein